MDNHIYVVGGYNGSQQLDTVERYDPETDKWHFCQHMSIARSALSLAVIDHKVYAIGQYPSLILGFISSNLYNSFIIACLFSSVLKFL